MSPSIYKVRQIVTFPKLFSENPTTLYLLGVREALSSCVPCRALAALLLPRFRGFIPSCHLFCFQSLNTCSSISRMTRFRLSSINPQKGLKQAFQ